MTLEYKCKYCGQVFEWMTALYYHELQCGLEYEPLEDEGDEEDDEAGEQIPQPVKR